MRTILATVCKLPVTWFLITWFALLVSLSLLADSVIRYNPSFPYVESHLAISGLPRTVYSWANFDGVHYLSIARDGHLSANLIQAFFPVFPTILSFAPTIGLPIIEFGLLANVFFSICFVYIWYYTQLITGVSKSTAHVSTAVFLVFPTSFFLVSLYTESLFLLLTVVTFMAVAKKNWLVAALSIGIASGTRLVGILLVPAVLLHILFEENSFSSTIRQVILTAFQRLVSNIRAVVAILAIGSSGLLWYMYFLYQNFSDPLYFVHVQPEFGTGRQDTIILLPQVLFRYLKILLTYRPFGLTYFATVQELVLTMLIAGGLVIAWYKKLVPSYQIIFSGLALLLPTLTGTLSSMPRYVLVALPAFTAFGWLLSNYPKLRFLWIACSTFFLVFNTILFVQGYWVA